MNRNLSIRRADNDASTLNHIASKLSALAIECAAIGQDRETAAPPFTFTRSLDPLTMHRAGELAQRVHNYLEARRARAKVLDGDWFADPAWDLLLDLLVSQYLERPVSISSACIAANVPTTTALRWIDKLVREGWLIREDDPTDRRRAHLRITPELAVRLEQWIEHYLPPSTSLSQAAAY